MTALYAVMATGGGIVQLLPITLVCVIGVILSIALCIGVNKGARRVSWTGMCWLLACVAFFFAFDKLSGTINGLSPTLKFIVALSIASGCVLCVLLISGICALAVRPKIKWVKKDSDIHTRDEDGVELDEEYEDYDDYENYQSRKEAVRKGYGTPSVFGRILGGLLCVINSAMILGTAVCLMLLIANATALKNGEFAGVFAWKMGGFPVAEKLLELAKKYALDALFIGILVSFVCKGNKKGFMAILRDLLKAVGLIGVGLGFFLPFSLFAFSPEKGGLYYLNKLVVRCEGAVKGLMGEKLPIVPIIGGRLLAGLLLVIAIIITLLLLNWLMKKASEGIQKVTWLRVADGGLSGVAYIVFGAILCVLVWAVIYVLGYYGILKLNELLVQETTLSQSLISVCEQYIKPSLDSFSAFVEKLKLPF